MASSVLVEAGGCRFLFDIGRGVSQRLVQSGLRQDDLKCLLLSHYHPDHISDLLPYLHAALYSQVDPRSCDLEIFGPPGLLDLAARMSDLLGAGAMEEQDRFRLRWHEVCPGPRSIGGLEVELFDLPPAGNQGVRFEVGTMKLALTGDSHFHQQEIDFLQGVDLAVIDSGHLESEELVDLAVTTGVPRIVCSHLYRDLEEATLNRRARERG